MSGILEILVGPSRKWRIDALRNLPFMGQRRSLTDYPILCAVRRSINQIVEMRQANVNARRQRLYDSREIVVSSL